MLSKSDYRKKLLEIKPILASKYHVSKIGYFGSYANGEQTSNSDLDMLVEFSQAVGWEFFNLEEFLEQSLGIRVDLVTREALKERIKESILNQVRYI